MIRNLNLVFLCAAAVFITQQLIFADEPKRAKATAPPNTEVFETSFEGTWFVDKQLKNEYEAAKLRLDELERNVRLRKIQKGNGKIALADAQQELEDLRKRIDDQKTLISAFDIETKTVEQTIELGPERLLIVTADRIKIVGWHEPNAKLVLVKKVLSAGEPVDEHMSGIEVTRKHRLAAELVGKTTEEYAAEKEQFLNGEDAKQMTAERLATNMKWIEDAAARHRHFTAFQGKKADLLTVKGLTHQEGNRHVSYELMTPNGNGQVGSRWLRHAEITLFVPKCTALLLQGCLVGTDISGVDAQLILTSSGSQNRDYDGTFNISEHRGSITILDVPIDSVEHVLGDVTIESTTEMVNTGTNHRGGMRRMYTPSPRDCVVSDVTGDLNARFTRSDLHLRDLMGGINVRNDFGATYLEITATLEAANHRIISQSGDIHVNVQPRVSVGQPIYLATSCGTATTNLSRTQLDDSNTTGGQPDGTRRSWRSFFTPKEGERSFRFGPMGRAESVLENAKRSAGLDVVSVAGHVEYTQEKE